MSLQWKTSALAKWYFLPPYVLPDQQISDQQLALETSPAAKSEEKRMFSQANQQWLENAIFRRQMF